MSTVNDVSGAPSSSTHHQLLDQSGEACSSRQVTQGAQTLHQRPVKDAGRYNADEHGG